MTKLVELSWCVYVLRCADGTLYCGIAKNLLRRLRQHNGELVGGAKYTRSRRPVVLLASKTCDSQGDAMRAERAFKKLSRREKLKEIEKWETASHSPRS